MSAKTNPTIRSRYREYAKFVAAGLANTAIDFLVFNALIFSIGPVNSATYAFCKAFAFSCAVINSYFLNKHWVFSDRISKDTKGSKGNYLRFFIVSVTAFIVNIAVSSAVFFLLEQGSSLNLYLAANIAAVTGTVSALALNYVGYKLFVFTSRS